MGRIRCSIILAGALAVGLAGVPTAQASTPEPMNPVQLQQAVLRAQPGTGLGAWTQNFYFSDRSNGQSPSDKVPILCPSTTKQAVTLPKANSYGMVGYAIDANSSMSITIWQYDTDAQAKQARDQFLATACADTPLIQGEDGNWYQTTGGGGDLSATQVDRVPAYEGGYEGTVDGGQAVAVSWAGRPVGKTFVRVEAVRYGDAAKSSAKSQRASRLIRSWIDRASRAVLKFSSADPNAA